jgi:hypothetical protein
MGNVSTTHAAGYSSPSAIVIPPQKIELRGVLVDGNALHAVFAAGESQRIIPVERRDLATFHAFQQRVKEFLGLRIEFAGDWPDAVAAAFTKGAAT